MLARLTAFLRPPVLDSEQETRSAYFLYVLISVGAAVAILLIVGFYLSGTLNAFRAGLMALFLGAFLVAYLLLQTKRIDSASYLFLATLLVLMGGAIVFTGGLNATAYSSLLLLIFCTGLLLGRRVMLVAAGGVALFTLVLAFLEHQGLMPEIQGVQTWFTRAMTQLVNLTTITSFAYYALRRIDEALGRAASSERALLKRNEQLLQEVQERKQVEQALAHNNAMLQATFNAVPDGILVVDLNRRFVATNGRFRQMWSIPESITDAEDARLLVHHKLVDAAEWDAQIADAYQNPLQERHMVLELADGSVFESFSLPQMLDGQPVGRVWSYRDVTSLKQAERATRTSERQFRELFDLAPIGMTITDLKGRFLQVNAAFCRTVGYSMAELWQMTFAQITHPDDLEKNLQFYQQLVRGEIAAYQYEKRYIRKDRTAVYVFIQVSVVYNSRDQVERLMAQVVDLTDLRQAQESLRQAQKLESLGLMSGGIAHDFNNLLTAILTQASLAQAKLPTDSPALRHIHRMVEASQRAASLTQQLLTFSGRGRRESHPLSLNLLIQESMSLLEIAIPKAVRLEVSLLPQLALMNGDEGQLQQVLMNLVLNAVEAMPSGENSINGRSDTIHLVTQTQTVTAQKQIWLVTGERLASGNYVRLDVTDNGSGMDEATLAKIFDPFFTTKRSGHGLGLATVMGIVRSHEGGLQVSSKPGKGTTFRLFFPALLASEAWTVVEEGLPAAATMPHHAQLLQGQILVIDDEAAVCEAVADVLAVEGINVLTAADGQSGIDLYQQHIHNIALILLDIAMPGISGTETHARLRQFAPTIPVILSSGYTSEPSDVAAALRHPHTTFLQKPYRWDELLGKIRPFLQQ
ncbi:MAG: PAS domain S-box protein [Anaerolineales bacterium]|nr:PAS domain S-box protein [Anaerolineales bacterium]